MSLLTLDVNCKIVLPTPKIPIIFKLVQF